MHRGFLDQGRFGPVWASVVQKKDESFPFPQTGRVRDQQQASSKQGALQSRGTGGRRAAGPFCFVFSRLIFWSRKAPIQTVASIGADGSLGTSLYMADEVKDISELQHDCVVAGTDSTSGAADGQLSYPNHIAIDNSGNIIVADHSNHRIQAISEEGGFICKTGELGEADGEFFYPVGVAVDKRSGEVFVADTGNHQVQVFKLQEETGGSTASLVFLRKFGSQGLEAGQVNMPYGIAISESSGNVLVCDYSNERVQVFTSGGDHVEMIGVGHLSTPHGVAVDEEDNIYVADIEQHQVLVFSKDGSLINKIGSEGTNNGELTDPSSICIDQHRGLVVVGDRHGIQAFSKQDGSFVRKLEDKMFTTTGLGVDSQGRILAANYDAHTIERWA